MGLLDALIYGVRDVLDGTFAPLSRKSRIALGSGLTGTVDDAHDCIVIGVPSPGTGLTVTLAEKHAPYTMSTANYHIVALDSGGTYKLPPPTGLVDGQSFELSNRSGGNITADGNGTSIYGAGSTETLVDAEVALYRYDSGAVSGSAKWIRVA